MQPSTEPECTRTEPIVRTVLWLLVLFSWGPSPTWFNSTFICPPRVRSSIITFRFPETDHYVCVFSSVCVVRYALLLSDFSVCTRAVLACGGVRSPTETTTQHTRITIDFHINMFFVRAVVRLRMRSSFALARTALMNLNISSKMRTHHTYSYAQTHHIYRIYHTHTISRRGSERNGEVYFLFLVPAF